MITLLQRVSEALVKVDNLVIAEIDQGLLVFVGIQADDTDQIAAHFLNRIINYRVFSDDNGKMNLSLLDVKGGLLLVPQFTLVADTNKGRRPGFSSAASPEHGDRVFGRMVKFARSCHETVEAGCFGADMQVELVNDGPVTFILD